MRIKGTDTLSVGPLFLNLKYFPQTTCHDFSCGCISLTFFYVNRTSGLSKTFSRDS